MKFLCLCYYDLARYEACTPEDFEAVARICQPHDEALRTSGHLDLVGSLALPSASSVIRPGEDGPIIDRGPYAPTPEPIGAFFILEADDLAQAIEVASRHPGAHLGRYFGGGIEVRPCDYFERPQG